MTLPASELVVVAALRLEARALCRGAPGLHVLRAGMGPARTRLSAARIFADPARTFAIAGLCGGLDASQPVGAVVVASEVRGKGDLVVPCEHAALAAQLRELGVEPQVGPVLSVDHIVRGRERDALRETGAIAVDMESIWLTRAIRQRPFAVVRVVLDAPGRGIVRLGTVPDTFRALRRLSEVAPALVSWAGLMPKPRDAARSRFTGTVGRS